MWDAIVIGAGVVGCATARELARYPLRILVLEKGPDICAGTSKGNSAMVHAGHDPEPGSQKAKFNLLGNPMFDALCAELDVPFERSGLITFATNEPGMQSLRRQKAGAAKNGVEVELLDLEGIRKIEPDMGDNVVGALWVKASGIVCPYNLVFAMAENAARNGAEFRTDCEAQTIEPLENGEPGWRVHTGQGSFDTRMVFNCAGTHADRLNNQVSTEQFRIIPRQGEHLIMDRKYAAHVKTTVGPPAVDLPDGSHTKGMGLMPSVDGTVIIGCNAINREDKDDTRSTAEGIGEILEFCAENWQDMPIGRYVEKLPPDAIISCFSAVRAHPEGDDYIIGEAPGAANFFNAAGIESPGLTAGPAIGVHLAELAAEKLNLQKRADWVPGRSIKQPFRTMTRAQREQAIKQDPGYAKIVCRCEQVTEAEIRDAINRPVGARSVNAVKMRTRAGMGRCQGGFCSPRVVEILCEELGLDPLDVCLAGENSNILKARVGEMGGEGA